MENLLSLLILTLMVMAMFAIGYDYAFDYGRRALHEDHKVRQLFLAKIDLWSYLLTAMPLFCSLLTLLNRDPPIGGSFEPLSRYADLFVSIYLIIAAIGVGAGVARRRLTILFAKS